MLTRAAKETAVEVEPVYVVVADARTNAPSRRSFLAAACAFACGGLVGSASGFAAASWASSDAAAGVRDEELERLRRLALSAPVDELLDEGWTFLARLGCDYREDQDLWRGFERLAERVTEPSADARCRELARFAREVLARADGSVEPVRSRWASMLEEVR
jgi:hypothetical protein